MLTDNPVMLRRQKPLPALMCAQRRAEKVIPDEEALIQSNINSFGSEIGKICLTEYNPGRMPSRMR